LTADGGFPSRDPSLGPGHALGFDRTILAGVGPVAPQHLVGFFVCIAIRQPLPGGTTIGVVLRQIDKVLLAEASVRFGARSHRLRQSYRDASFVAGKDLRAVEVAAVGNGLEGLGLQYSLCLPGHIGELRPSEPLFVTSWAMIR
jgi:hypothetical protein